ncbi:hypothetical protein IJT17_05190 [bacterium]|nr:hypothetical protein [bacterium]
MGINWSNMWSLQGEMPVPLDAGSVCVPPKLEEEKREFLERTAAAIVRRHLTVPAVLALESLRPMSFIGSQALLVLSPMLSLAVSARDLQTLYSLLEERNGIELLLEFIEKYDSEWRG